MTLDLDAIEARWRATTPGPWERCHHGTWEVQAPPNQRVADFGTIDRAEADAVFAAHAHQDIPALIAEIRRLRATTIPTRIDAPDGSTAEIIAVTARCANATGGTGHQTMTVGRWRQDSEREELRGAGWG